MKVLILRLLISLLLTLLIECGLAIILRIKGKDLLLVFLVNLMTNPAAVLISILTGDVQWIQFLIEAVVIFTEGCYYKKYSRCIERGMLVSMLLIGVSYGLGLLFNIVF